MTTLAAAHHPLATGGLFDLLEKPAPDPLPLSRRGDPNLTNNEFIIPADCRDDADDFGFIEANIDIPAPYEFFKPRVGAGCRLAAQ